MLFTPAAALELLESSDAATVADQLLLRAQQGGRAADMVRIILDGDEAVLRQRLDEIAVVAPWLCGGWNAVARWLLDHDHERQAIVAAVRQQVAALEAQVGATTDPTAPEAPREDARIAAPDEPPPGTTPVGIGV